MFDLNLLAKAGIQPEVTRTNYSFIEQRTKQAVIPVKELVEDEPYRDHKGKRKLLPIILPFFFVIIIAAVYFYNTEINTVSIPKEIETISVQEELANAISMLGKLSNKVYLQRFLLTPEVILLNLRSDDQIELNMLSMALEDLLQVQCRISGSKEYGVLLSASIPISYESRELNNTAAVKGILQSLGIEKIEESTLKITASVSDTVAYTLLKNMMDADLIYYKKLWLECQSDEVCQFELLYDASPEK